VTGVGCVTVAVHDLTAVRGWYEQALGVRGTDVASPELGATGVRFAIGEFGGFTSHISGRRFYPVQVAEKQVCTVRLTVRGQPGHGSLPVRGGAMAKLAQVLRRLDRERLPVHVTPVARDMVEATAAALPRAQGAVLRMLLRPRTTNLVLDRMGEGDRARESWETLIKTFPDSDLARLAKQNLDRLNRGKPPGE